MSPPRPASSVGASSQALTRTAPQAPLRSSSQQADTPALGERTVRRGTKHKAENQEVEEAPRAIRQQPYRRAAQDHAWLGRGRAPAPAETKSRSKAEAGSGSGSGSGSDYDSEAEKPSRPSPRPVAASPVRDPRSQVLAGALGALWQAPAASWTAAQRATQWSAHIRAALAATPDPAAREALAATLGELTGAVLTQGPPAERADLLARATSALARDAQQTVPRAFFRTLLVALCGPQLAGTASGRAWVAAALDPRPELAQGDGPWQPMAHRRAFHDAALALDPPCAADTAQWLARACASTIPENHEMHPAEPAEHDLITPLLHRSQQDPSLPLAAWARGFTEGLAGRLDAGARLMRLMAGVAHEVAGITPARARSLGQALTQGLGGAQLSPDDAAHWMHAVLRMLPRLPPTQADDFFQGCLQGLDAASTTPAVLRRIAREVNLLREHGPLHDHSAEAVACLRTAFGQAAFDAALAATRAPGDLPSTGPLAPPVALTGTPGERIAQLQARIAALGPVITQRPALPAVAPQEREAARLWLALGAEHTRIGASELSEAERAPLNASLASLLADLQAYIPPPEPALSAERVRGVLQAFQARDAHGLDAAAWHADTCVLGWRLGLDGTSLAAHEHAALAAALRTQRLVALGASEAARSGLDLVLLAVFQMRARPRALLHAAQRVSNFAPALRALFNHPEPEAAQDRAALAARMAFALEWFTRAAALAVRSAATAAVATLGYIDGAFRDDLDTPLWATAPDERRALVRAVATGVRADQDAAGRDALLAHWLDHAPSHNDARALAEVLGAGEPLRQALAFVARRPAALSSDRVAPVVLGLCHREGGAADLLLKTARDFPLADKLRLLNHHWATPNQTVAMAAIARHLADPPAAGDPRHAGGAALTRDEVREWALAYGLARGLPRGDRIAHAAVIEREFERLPPTGVLAGTAPAAAPAWLDLCRDAIRTVLRPSRLLQLAPAQLSHARQRQLLQALLACCPPQVVSRELGVIATVPLHDGTTPQAIRHNRLHRVEALWMVVRNFGDSLTRASLPTAHQAMLNELQAMQDSYPAQDPERAAHAVAFLQARECLIGLYQPEAFAAASTVGFALRVPGPDAADGAMAQHLIALHSGADGIAQVLRQLQAALAEADQAIAAGERRQAAHEGMRSDLGRMLAPALHGMLASPALAAQREGAFDRDSLMLPMWRLLRPQLQARANELRQALARIEPPAPVAPAVGAAQDDAVMGLEDL